MKKPGKPRKKGVLALSRLSILDLLPNKPSQLVVDVDRERQELYSHILLTHGEASRRIEQLDESRRNDNEAQTDQKTALALLLRGHEIALRHNQDAFAELKERLGLNEARERLEQELLDKIAFAAGLKVFNARAKKLLKRSFKSIQEINEIFPQITMLEIAFLALLEEAPESMFTYGATFLREGFNPECQQCVPMHYASNVETLVYAVDMINSDLSSEIAAKEAFGYLGMTGNDERLEFVPLKADVKQRLGLLIPLILSNKRLHQCVWSGCAEGLMVGFGKISAEAYRKTFVMPSNAPITPTLPKAIEALTGNSLARYNELRDAMERTVHGAAIVDLARETMLRSGEMFKLVGLLQRMPKCLTGETPFCGYISPYGVGVKFIDRQGKVVDYVPYSDWNVRQAVLAFHGEAIDLSHHNRTATVLFDSLTQRAELKVFEGEFGNASELSILEEIQIDLWLKHRIKLELACRDRTIELRSMADVIHYGLTPHDHHVFTNIKFGVDEARQIKTMIGLLPQALLTGVKSICKFNFDSQSPESIMNGTATLGEYLPETGEVVLYGMTGELYAEISPARKALRGFTLVHEIGESVWQFFSAEQRSAWKKISWNGTPMDKAQHFLTWYSHAKDERDDFCDHFACYILHGPEFKAKGQQYRPLGLKYRFMQNLFLEKTGSAVEYPQILGWTTEELHGAIEREANTQTLEEAIEAIERRMREEEQEAKKRIGRYVSSWEELVERAHANDDDEEIA